MSRATEDRRRFWEARFDQGLHGHAAGDRDAWVQRQLDTERNGEKA